MTGGEGGVVPSLAVVHGLTATMSEAVTRAEPNVVGGGPAGNTTILASGRPLSALTPLTIIASGANIGLTRSTPPGINAIRRDFTGVPESSDELEFYFDCALTSQAANLPVQAFCWRTSRWAWSTQ
jgi:hypothetical protein